MSPRAEEEAVVAALRAGAEKPAAVRAATGLTVSAVAAAVQRLRYQGKIKFDRLELSASMLADPPPAIEGQAFEPEAIEGAAGQVPTPIAAPTFAEASAGRPAGAPKMGGGIVFEPIAPVAAPARLTLAERVQTLAVAGAEDLEEHVEAQHKALWWRIVFLGRAMRVSPARALQRAIAAGLAALEPEYGLSQGAALGRAAPASGVRA